MIIFVFVLLVAAGLLGYRFYTSGQAAKDAATVKAQVTKTVQVPQAIVAAAVAKAQAVETAAVTAVADVKKVL